MFGHHLNIKVIDNQNEVFFKIRKTTKLTKLKSQFCDRTGKDVSRVEFFFNGERVSSDQTPNDLGMEDGDAIEATSS